ncbi:MAG: hypothetical protein ACYTEL_16165 [Planctomycetota bacterium]|jgi:hypothetical protein
MIERETLLILGAGASVPYGFPSGGELVSRIKVLLDHPETSTFQLLRPHPLSFRADCIQEFIRSLHHADPPSVDAWLEHNEEFVEIGKAAIALALLRAEQKSNLRPTNSWYQYLFSQLSGSFEHFDKNRVSIITFNYDRSLEHYLYMAFTNTHSAIKSEDCAQKLKSIPIVHPYGSLGHFEWQAKKPFPVPFGHEATTDMVHQASRNIKIIPETNQDPTVEFQQARELITQAQSIYFLGFGYHQTNIERLGFESIKKATGGTIKKLSYQRIRDINRWTNYKLGAAQENIIDTNVYDFLYNHVDFNRGRIRRSTERYKP